MKKISTESVPEPIGPYSQAIAHGNTLYISGQIGVNVKTGKMENASLRAEMEQVMENLKALLKAGGSSFSQTIKCSIFLTDIGSFAEVNNIYESYFEDHFPARETVEVSKLPAGAKVEISAIASLD